MTTFNTWQEAKQYAQSVFEDYLRKRGIKTNQSFKCLNPAHDDKHPSMSYDKKRNRVKCFSCGADYDIFSLYAAEHGEAEGREMFEGVFRELGIEIASREGNVNQPAPVKWQPKSSLHVIKAKPQKEDVSEKKVPLSPLGESIPAYYARISQCLEDEDFKKYMQSRGIPDFIYKSFPIGYDARYPLGKKYYHAVVFFSEEHDTYEARIINGTGDTPRYLEPVGGKHFFFNSKALNDNTLPVFICEGCFDALSILTVDGMAIGLTSLSNIGEFKKLIREKLDKNNLLPPIILCFDTDINGQEKQAELARELAQYTTLFVWQMDRENFAVGDGECYYKDPNDILKEKRESFISAIYDTQESVYNAAKERQKQRREEYSNRASDASRINDMQSRLETTKAFSPTGFRVLDDELGGGLYAGMYIIGAESSLGKTTFCLQIADQIAARGVDVLFFSLEMSTDELMAKSISRLSYEIACREKKTPYYASTTRQILTASLRKKRKEEAETLLRNAYKAYREKIGKYRYTREGIGNIGVDEIHQAVKEHIQITGRRPLVIIDYLQILKPVDMRGSDKQNTDRAMLALKQFSRDEDLPIIAISSFNRENYNAPISMASFKESGAIEYSSDVLLGLQYLGSEYKDGESENERKRRIREEKKARREEISKGKPAKVELKILKNRNGMREAHILYDYWPAFNQFQELGMITSIKQEEEPTRKPIVQN